MANIGFDNEQYLLTQSERIRNRINQFGGKLYLDYILIMQAFLI